jgi:hypothetical protein
MHCVATGRSVTFTPDSGGASITPDQWVQIHAGIHTVQVRHAGLRRARPIECDLGALHGGYIANRRRSPASHTQFFDRVSGMCAGASVTRPCRFR